MSFELLFRARERSGGLDYDAFVGHFGRRPDYTLQRSTARYDDEATGVSFAFAYGAAAGPGLTPVTFSLPFCRPHTFALEAEPEVAAFVDRFDLVLVDPEPGGLGEAEHGMTAFLAAYDRGNERAVRVLVEHVAESPPHTLPGRSIEWIWYWNRHRRLSQLAGGGLHPYAHRREGVFVPKIMFLSLGGQVRSVVVWPDGIPVSLPAVDALILARDKLAPRRLGRRRADLCLVPFEAALCVLDRFPTVREPLPHHLLAYREPPEVVVSFFRSQDPYRGELEGVTPDRILDAELVTAATRGTRATA